MISIRDGWGRWYTKILANKMKKNKFMENFLGKIKH
jgi:hypothetical protein